MCDTSGIFATLFNIRFILSMASLSAREDGFPGTFVRKLETGHSESGYGINHPQCNFLPPRDIIHIWTEDRVVHQSYFLAVDKSISVANGEFAFVRR
jgi:hypothetical protein